MQPLPLSTTADTECLRPLLADVAVDGRLHARLREQLLEGQRVEAAPCSSDLLQVASRPQGQLLRQVKLIMVLIMYDNTGVPTVLGSLLVHTAWVSKCRDVWITMA